MVMTLLPIERTFGVFLSSSGENELAEILYVKNTVRSEFAAGKGQRDAHCTSDIDCAWRGSTDTAFDVAGIGGGTIVSSS